MLSIKKAKTILNTNRKGKLNDQQVKQVLTLLEVFARISVEVYKNSEV